MLEIETSIWPLTLMFLFSFIAGFIDSVAGGGGLVQLPALLNLTPGIEIPTIFGTNKIAGFAGTSIAALQYARREKLDYKLLLLIAAITAVAAFWGAKTLHLIDRDLLKPLILVILIIIALYTYLKKDLGARQTRELSPARQYFYGLGLGLVIGFYDGFFGPGTGSFLMLGFVVVLGFDFVIASAYAKIINSVANISALTVFIRNGNFILHYAVVMAVANILGNFIGSRTALKRGNAFIRMFFLIIVLLLIIRFANDVFNIA